MIHCVDMCYQKSVSTALVQCLTRKREERSMFWKSVTQHKSIQSSKEDSSSCLVCQFPKQRLMLCHSFHCFSVLLLLRRYWRWSVQLALPLALSWFSFGTGQWTHSFFPFSSETLEWRSRKTFAEIPFSFTSLYRPTCFWLILVLKLSISTSFF